MKNILITGGAGFIGLNLVTKLIQNKNNKIFVVDALKYSSNIDVINKYKKKINFSNIDIINHKKLDYLINKIKPDIVFHLAAESHVDRSIDNPSNFIKSNINGTFNLIYSLNKYYRTLIKIKKKILSLFIFLLMKFLEN